MSWVRVLLLRLTLGLFLTVLIQGGLAAMVLAPNSAGAAPWLFLLAPLVIGLGGVFGLMEGWQAFRWTRSWLPLAQGDKELGDQPERRLKAALRALNSPLVLPHQAKRRTSAFLEAMAGTLLAAKRRESWAWEIYRLAWPTISTTPSLLDGLAVVVREAEDLHDTSWQLGLQLLAERPDDTRLAIRLAQGSMHLGAPGQTNRRFAALEDAWWTAYRSDGSLRDMLLPPLTRRYLDSQRRDEQAGRLYIDSFVHLGSTPELAREMGATADALEATGGDPEVVANLRALSRTRPRGGEIEMHIGPSSSSDSPPEIDLADPADAGVLFDFVPGEDMDSEEDPEDRPVTIRASREDDSDLLTTISNGQPTNRTGLYVVGAGLLVALIVTVIILFTRGGGEAETPVPTGPVAVQSVQPFTVQVAALPTKERAETLIGQLRAQDLDAYLVITERADKTWYRVHMGHFDEITAAQAYADSLKQLGRIDDYFVARFEDGVIPVPRMVESDSTP